MFLTVNKARECLWGRMMDKGVVAGDKHSAESSVRKYRVAYLVSHPIQYQAPLLRLLSAQPDIDLTVFFQSDISVRRFHDQGFGRAIEWDVPLLDGYKYEFLPSVRRGDTTSPWSYGIVSRLWRGKFDFLWVHGYARWFNWVAMVAARMASIPILVRDEANLVSRARSPVKTWVKRNVFFRALRSLCDGYLAIGTLNRQFYIDNGVDPDDVFWVPYSVDNDYFFKSASAAAPHREDLRASLGLSPGRPIILFASKFERRKHADDLFAAFVTMLERHDGGMRPYLLFIGDGQMRAALEEKAIPYGEDVRFLGFRNQSELPVFFDLCDVFVLPSELEPWGLVVNEAMSAGRAVVVSDQVGCAVDLVRNGVNGYSYPFGNVAALAKALSQVLRSRENILEMGRASAEIMNSWNFDSDIDGITLALNYTVKNMKHSIE